MRILFLQPSLQPPGGGNGVAAWMLQALKDAHEVTVLTWAAIDLDAINRFWGTTLRPGDFRALRVPAGVRRLVDALPAPLALLRRAIMLRIARPLSAGYDVPVTANNEGDLGGAGVQYIHYPWNLFPRPAVDLRWYHLRALLPLYYRLCDVIAQLSPTGVQRNVTLVNSEWTGRLVRARYGVVGRTVYPPVTAQFPSVPWEARRPGFVCIGRIAPEKELDRVIDIVAGVRAQVPGVQLHIVGTPDHRAYHRRIAARARAAGFAVHENLARGELMELVAGQRYGIHGMREEHFGMAPAELVCAGCVVWVPDGGGQVEIVGDARLCYGGVEDAVVRIVRTLRDPTEEAALRAHLATRAPLFSTDRFMAEIRRAVADAGAPRPRYDEAAVAMARKPGSRASSSS
jgi:glycosyltransferase involved in cell wall biosynthesis